MTGIPHCKWVLKGELIMEEAIHLSGRGWGRQSNSGGVCRHTSMGGGGESEDRREDDSSDCERCTHVTHCYIHV